MVPKTPDFSVQSATQRLFAIIHFGGVIFVQLILDNFGDNHFSLLVIGQKQ